MIDFDKEFINIDLDKYKDHNILKLNYLEESIKTRDEFKKIVHELQTESYTAENGTFVFKYIDYNLQKQLNIQLKELLSIQSKRKDNLITFLKSTT